MPGEIGQVDWAHFGHLQIGRARRALMAFVIVLSWSRQVFVKFFLDARMESFLRGHIAAFAAWDGLPRILLYDNLLCGAPHKTLRVRSWSGKVTRFVLILRYWSSPVITVTNRVRWHRHAATRRARFHTAPRGLLE
jgi:transposase